MRPLTILALVAIDQVSAATTTISTTTAVIAIATSVGRAVATTATEAAASVAPILTPVLLGRWRLFGVLGSLVAGFNAFSLSCVSIGAGDRSRVASYGYWVGDGARGSDAEKDSCDVLELHVDCLYRAECSW